MAKAKARPKAKAKAKPDTVSLPDCDDRTGGSPLERMRELARRIVAVQKSDVIPTPKHRRAHDR